MPEITDPVQPDYCLDSFPRAGFRGMAGSSGRRACRPHVWTTETTHRDGQQGGMPLTDRPEPGHLRHSLPLHRARPARSGRRSSSSTGLRTAPRWKARSNATRAARRSSRRPGFAPREGRRADRRAGRARNRDAGLASPITTPSTSSTPEPGRNRPPGDIPRRGPHGARRRHPSPLAPGRRDPRAHRLHARLRRGRAGNRPRRSGSDCGPNSACATRWVLGCPTTTSRCRAAFHASSGACAPGPPPEDLEFHPHNDTWLVVANCLAAVREGCARDQRHVAGQRRAHRQRPAGRSCCCT